MKGERGFALVITLIITALLVALSAEFSGEVYVDTASRQGFVDGQQASLMAKSGVTAGIRILQRSIEGQPFTSLSDQWAKPLELEDDAGKLTVVIEDESGKLNLNYLTSPNGSDNEPYYGIFTRLLKKLALPVNLAAATADWVDEDDLPRAAGAETTYYAALKPPGAAKNKRLETLEEIRLIKGIDSAAMEKLRPLVTVYPEDPNSPAAPININTAPAEVIGAIDPGMTDGLTARILEYRKETPFKNPSQLGNIPGMESIALGLQTKIGVQGKVFRVRSQAQVKETIRIVEAVVRLGTGTSTVLYWREY